MKKKIILFFLLFIGFLLTSCDPQGIKLEEKNGNEQLNTPERIEEKLLWNGDVDEDFIDNQVLVIIDQAYTETTFKAEDFELSLLELENLTAGTYEKYKDELSPKFHQIYKLTLSEKSKENVVEAIEVLEKLEFVRYAGPCYIRKASAWSSELGELQIEVLEIILNSFIHEPNIEDFNILAFFGIYNSNIIVKLDSQLANIEPAISSDLSNIYVWKMGKFYDLDEALVKELITENDYVLVDLLNHFDGEISFEELRKEYTIRKIKQDYLDSIIKPIEPTATLADISILHYYGSYPLIRPSNSTSLGNIVVMMDSTHLGYTGAEREILVGGVKIKHPDGNQILVWSNGVFYTLEAAYTNKILTKEELIEVQRIQNEYYPFLDLDSEIIHPTLYPVYGDGFEAEDFVYNFKLINSEAEFLKLNNPPNGPVLDVANFQNIFYNWCKTLLPNNEIGSEGELFNLVMDDSGIYFPNNKLVHCSITTYSSGYASEVYFKVQENGKVALVFDKFNDFTKPGDGLVLTINFFISIPNHYYENMEVILDGEVITDFFEIVVREDRENSLLVDGVNYTEEQETIFKEAYLDSISEYLDEPGNLDDITIMKYYGKFGEVDMASMTSSYDINPYKIYIEFIENMQFRYDHAGRRVFGVYEGKLYTIKQAYDKGLLDFDDLCELFVINSISVLGLTKEELMEIEGALNKNAPIESGYFYKRYYGKYNGYSAIIVDNYLPRAAVVVDEVVLNLSFRYPYPGTYIRLIKGDEIYSITKAFQNGILSAEDVYYLYQIHSDSDPVNEVLINNLLSPVSAIHKRFIEDYSLRNLNLTKYYGKYNDCHLFSFQSSRWIAGNLLPEEDLLLNSLLYGGSSSVYVLHNDKLYLLDEAISAGLLKEEIKSEITSRYYTIRKWY